MAQRRIVLSNSGGTDSICFGVGTESNGVLTDCLGIVADSYRLGTDCRGADARSQSIIAGSTLIFVVGIRIWFDRMYTVIMNTTTCTTAASISNQVDNFL